MLKLIVAMDANRGIGLNEKMPWHIPEEMKIFRTLTLNHSLLFGRNYHIRNLNETLNF